MLARRIALILILLVLRTSRGHAQDAAGAAGSASLPIGLPFEIAGPPPPDFPATIARDVEGRATIRAVRLEAPLKIDGRLEEIIYTSVLPISDFIQTEPKSGEAATEK